MEVSGRESRGRGTESRQLTAPVATPRVTRGRSNRWDRSDGGQRPVHQVGEDVTTERATAGSLQMEPRARLRHGQGAGGSLWRKRDGSFIRSFVHSLRTSWVPTVLHRTSRVRRGDHTEPPPTPSRSVALTSHCWRLVLAEVLGGWGIISEKVMKEDLCTDLGRAWKRGRLFVLAAMERRKRRVTGQEGRHRHFGGFQR